MNPVIIRKKTDFGRRQGVLGAILLCYFLPLVLVNVFGLFVKNGWFLFSFGLFIAILGTIIFFLRLFYWEMKNGTEIALVVPIKEEKKLQADSSKAIAERKVEVQPIVENAFQKDLSDCQIQQVQLLKEIEEKNNAFQLLCSEKEQLARHIQSILQEFSSYKSTMQEQIQQKEILIREGKEALLAQEALVEKLEQQIESLESKELDLTYEIKTLLQLINIDSQTQSPLAPPPHLSIEPEASYFPPCYSLDDPGLLDRDHDLPYAVPQFQSLAIETTPFPLLSPSTQLAQENTGAAVQLKRCLDIASKMTGSANLNSLARIREFPVESYALDLRRLCDSLNNESQCIVILFSLKENKLLFVNHHVKNVLGWSPEKFIQDFREIIHKTDDEWKATISLLTSQPETKLKLCLKTKEGPDANLNCHLGAITTGKFRHHVIGILSASE